jgi:hypothetical protein
MRQIVMSGRALARHAHGGAVEPGHAARPAPPDKRRPPSPPPRPSDNRVQARLRARNHGATARVAIVTSFLRRPDTSR